MGIKNILGSFGNSFKFSSEHVPTKTKFGLAFTTSSASLSVVFIGNIFIKYYTDILKVDPVLVGAIYYWINIWMSINGIVIGYLIDRVKYHPKKGKYVRVLKKAAPLMILTLFGMIIASPNFPEWLIATLFVIELMVFYTAFTTYTYAYNCYYLLVAPTKEDRIDVGVIMAYVSNTLSFFATLIPNFLLVGNDSMPRETIMFWLLVVLAFNATIYLIALRALKDPAELYMKGGADSEKINLKTLWTDVKSFITMRGYWSVFLFNLAAVTPMSIAYTVFLFMMDHAIGATGLQAAIVDTGPMILVLLMLPMIGNLIKRIGAKHAIFLAMVPFLCGQMLLFVSPNWIFAFFAYILIYLGHYSVTTAHGPLGAAVVDENERITNVRKTGLQGAITAVLNMPFAGIWTLVFMALIKHFGYVQGAPEQTEEALRGIRMSGTFLPSIMYLVAIVPLVLNPYNKRKEAEISEWSRHRRSNDAAETAEDTVGE